MLPCLQSPLQLLKSLAVDPVHRNPQKVLLVWLGLSELICCWNTPFCFRLKFETADDQDFIAVQNAIEEVISELKILPGLSSLEEVRVNAVTLMGEFGWRAVSRNCKEFVSLYLFRSLLYRDKIPASVLTGVCKVWKPLSCYFFSILIHLNWFFKFQIKTFLISF